MGNGLFQWVLTGREKTDGEFCPDVGFGCHAHKTTGFLIQMRAGEINCRLGLCTLGRWGLLSGGREQWRLAALQGKVGQEPSAVTQPAEAAASL